MQLAARPVAASAHETWKLVSLFETLVSAPNSWPGLLHVKVNEAPLRVPDTTMELGCTAGTEGTVGFVGVAVSGAEDPQADRSVKQISVDLIGRDGDTAPRSALSTHECRDLDDSLRCRTHRFVEEAVRRTVVDHQASREPEALAVRGERTRLLDGNEVVVTSVEQKRWSDWLRCTPW